MNERIPFRKKKRAWKLTKARRQKRKMVKEALFKIKKRGEWNELTGT